MKLFKITFRSTSSKISNINELPGLKKNLNSSLSFAQAASSSHILLARATPCSSLRSHQASQQTNSGHVRDQPGLPVPTASLI